MPHVKKESVTQSQNQKSISKVILKRRFPQDFQNTNRGKQTTNSYKTWVLQGPAKGDAKRSKKASNRPENRNTFKQPTGVHWKAQGRQTAANTGRASAISNSRWGQGTHGRAQKCWGSIVPHKLPKLTHQGSLLVWGLSSRRKCWEWNQNGDEETVQVKAREWYRDRISGSNLLIF